MTDDDGHPLPDGVERKDVKDLELDDALACRINVLLLLFKIFDALEPH